MTDHLFPKRKGRFHKLLVLVSICALVMALIPSLVLAGQVTVASVTPGETTAGANTTYEMDFTIQTAIGGGDKIMVTFPTGYTLGTNTPSTVEVVYDGTSYGPVDVAASVVSGGSRLTMTLGSGFADGSLAPVGSQIIVRNLNVTNPTVAESYTVEVSTNKDTAGSDAVLITADSPAKVGLAPVSSTTQAGTSTTLTISVLDQYENIVDVATAVYLSDGNEDGTFQPVSPVNVTGQENVDYRNNKVGTYTITASADGLESAQATVEVTPALISSITVNIPEGVDVNLAPGIQINEAQRVPLNISLFDEFDNAATQGYVLNLSIDPANGAFYSDATNPAAIDVVTVLEGLSAATVYYSGQSAAGNPAGVTLNVTSGSVNGSVYIEIMPNRFQISVGSPVEVFLRTAVTITLVDSQGNAIAPQSDLTASLSSDNLGTFYDQQVDGNDITETGATIPGGETGVTVYYRPEAVGTHTLTAAVGSVTGNASLIVNPALATRSLVTSVEPDIITAGGERPEMTITIKDQYWNDVSAPVGGMMVALFTESPTGRFYDAATGGNEIGSVTISEGQASATVYFVDTTAGDWWVWGESPQVESWSTGTITVIPAAANHLELAFEPGNESCDGYEDCEALIVSVQDPYGNLADLTQLLTVVLSGTSATGYFTEETGWGRISQVTLGPEQGSEHVVFYHDPEAQAATLTATTPGLTDGMLSLEATAIELMSVGAADQGDRVSFWVKLVDANGRPARAPTNVTVTVYATNGGSIAMSGLSLPIGSQTTLTLAKGSRTVGAYLQLPDAAGDVDLIADASTSGYGTVQATVAVGALLVNTRSLGLRWNILSTPIALASGKDTLGDVLQFNSGDFDDNVAAAWTYDSATGWSLADAATQLKPLDAVFIKLKGAAVAMFYKSTAVTAPPTRNLDSGWHLVSLADLDSRQATQALASLGGAWSQVVSPGLNQDSWTAVWGHSNGLMNPAEGYWLNMVWNGTLAGFTTTP